MTIYSLNVSFTSLEPVCRSMSSSNCCFLTCIQVCREAGQGVWDARLSAAKRNGPLIQATIWMHHKLIFSEWKKPIEVSALHVSTQMKPEGANLPVITAVGGGEGFKEAFEVTHSLTWLHRDGCMDVHVYHLISVSPEMCSACCMPASAQ